MNFIQEIKGDTNISQNESTKRSNQKILDKITATNRIGKLVVTIDQKFFEMLKKDQGNPHYLLTVPSISSLKINT